MPEWTPELEQRLRELLEAHGEVVIGARPDLVKAKTEQAVIDFVKGLLQPPTSKLGQD